MLSTAAEVGAAKAPPQGGPTVSELSSYYGSVVNNSQIFINGSASSSDVRIDVYATARRGKPFLIGQTTPQRGSWSVRAAVPLANGLYTIQARAVDLSTGVAGALTPMASKLTVDDVGPQVVGVRLVPRRGQIVITFRDFGGDRNAGTALDMRTATSVEVYDFGPSTGGASDPRWQTTSVDASPARRGSQQVVVTINGGAPIPDGSYRLDIWSPGPSNANDVHPDFYQFPYLSRGVKDVTGNRLQGGATSTVSPRDANDYATMFVVRRGLASQLRSIPPSGRG